MTKGFRAFHPCCMTRRKKKATLLTPEFIFGQSLKYKVSPNSRFHWQQYWQQLWFFQAQKRIIGKKNKAHLYLLLYKVSDTFRAASLYWMYLGYLLAIRQSRCRYLKGSGEEKKKKQSYKQVKMTKYTIQILNCEKMGQISMLIFNRESHLPNCTNQVHHFQKCLFQFHFPDEGREKRWKIKICCIKSICDEESSWRAASAL